MGEIEGRTVADYVDWGAEQLSEETLAKVAALKNRGKARDVGEVTRWDELAMIAEIFGGEIAAGMEQGRYSSVDYRECLAAAVRARAARQLARFNDIRMATAPIMGGDKAAKASNQYAKTLIKESGA